MAEKAFTQITNELKAGMQAFIQKDFRKAIQLCDLCLKKNPADVNALNLKGRSLTKTSHFHDAERHLRIALQILPNGVDSKKNFLQGLVAGLVWLGVRRDQIEAIFRRALLIQ